MAYKYNPTRYRSQVVAKKARRTIILFMGMENGKTIKVRAYKALEDHPLSPGTIGGHFRNLMNAGLIVRHELAKAEGAEPPKGELEKFIWNHLPTTRRDVMSAAIRHFPDLTTPFFGKVYQAMHVAGMFVRHQYELTAIGEFVLYQIQRGKDGDPAELIPKEPPRSARDAVRFQCGHTEIIEIRYWTDEDKAESIKHESVKPCPKCRDG